MRVTRTIIFRWALATGLATGLTIGLSACSSTPVEEETTATTSGDSAIPAGYEQTLKYLRRARSLQPQVISDELHVFQLEENVWMHRSYMSFGDQRLHANGLIVFTDEGITIVDAPWTPIGAYDLLEWLEGEFPLPVKRLVITHAHEDRIGGIDPFVERNIPIYSREGTADAARQHAWNAPNFLMEDDLPLRSGSKVIELFYPGPAHTADNIIAWIPEGDILFGGCMVKSRYAASLGFTGDANEELWPQSLRRAMSRYPNAKLVIPGHGLPGDRELIEHTLELLEE